MDAEFDALLNDLVGDLGLARMKIASGLSGISLDPDSSGQLRLCEGADRQESRRSRLP